MRKPLLLLPAGAVIAIAVASTGGAQTPEGSTVTVFQDVPHESSKFVDHAPKRLSMGDEHVSRTPVLDRRGGSRVGTLYAHAAVVKGDSFRTAVFQAQVVLALDDGTITLSGLAGTAARPFAVTGGTGAYSGARGTASEKEVQGGARLVVRLLP
jgi:hypothetical protein